MAFMRTATVCVCLLAMSRLMAAVGEAPPSKLSSCRRVWVLIAVWHGAAFPRLGDADDRQDGESIQLSLSHHRITLSNAELDMLPPVPEDVECYQGLRHRKQSVLTFARICSSRGEGS